MKIKLRLISYFSIICMLSTNTKVQNIIANVNKESIAVTQKLNEFVSAFRNLEWEKFTACFADDATAFFPPSANFPSRANNKDEIENIFEKVFKYARKQKSTPPYISIEPKNMKIQMLNEVAIVTFELNDTGMFGRRTLVLKKENDNWLIVHLHASGIVQVK